MYRQIPQNSVSLTQELDCFATLDHVDALERLYSGYYEKVKEKEAPEIPIVGVFAPFGEGKSTLVDTLETRLENAEAAVYLYKLDLWKYEGKEIAFDFHKIHLMEKKKYSMTGKLDAHLIGLSQDLLRKSPSTFKLKRNPVEYAQRESYFANRFSDDLQMFWKRRPINFSQRVVLCLENLDRLTTQNKVFALSAIHSHRDYLRTPVLITLDPHSIAGEKSYYEDLIHKTFTVGIHLYPKSHHAIQRYIHQKIKQIDGLNDEFTYDLSNMILELFPLSPREVNHIFNTFLLYLNQENKTHDELTLFMFLGIIQTLARPLYLRILQNPFLISGYRDAALSDIHSPIEGVSANDAGRINKLLHSMHHYDFFIPSIWKTLSPLYGSGLDMYHCLSAEECTEAMQHACWNVKHQLDPGVLHSLKQIANALLDAEESYKFIVYYDRLLGMTEHRIKDDEQLKELLLELFMRASMHKQTFIAFLSSQSNENSIKKVLLDETILQQKQRSGVCKALLFLDYSDIQHPVFFETVAYLIWRLFIEPLSRSSNDTEHEMLKLTEALRQRCLENFSFFRSFHETRTCEMTPRLNVLMQQIFNRMFLTTLHHTDMPHQIRYYSYLFPYLDAISASELLDEINTTPLEKALAKSENLSVLIDACLEFAERLRMDQNFKTRVRSGVFKDHWMFDQQFEIEKRLKLYSLLLDGPMGDYAELHNHYFYRYMTLFQEYLQRGSHPSMKMLENFSENVIRAQEIVFSENEIFLIKYIVRLLLKTLKNVLPEYFDAIAKVIFSFSADLHFYEEMIKYFKQYEGFADRVILHSYFDGNMELQTRTRYFMTALIDTTISDEEHDCIKYLSLDKMEVAKKFGAMLAITDKLQILEDICDLIESKHNTPDMTALYLGIIENISFDDIDFDTTLSKFNNINLHKLLMRYVDCFKDADDHPFFVKKLESIYSEERISLDETNTLVKVLPRLMEKQMHIMKSENTFNKDSNAFRVMITEILDHEDSSFFARRMLQEMNFGSFGFKQNEVKDLIERMDAV